MINKYIFSLILSVLCCTELHAQLSAADIKGLDYLLQKKDSINKHKQQTIAAFYKQKTASKEEAYNRNEALYQEYFVYNSDSALVYLQHNHELAVQMNDTAKLAYIAIQRCFLYSATGLLVDAKDQMDTAEKYIALLSESERKRALLTMFYEQCIYYCSHRIQHGDGETVSNRNVEEERKHFVDLAYAITQPTDKNYFWVVTNYAIVHDDSKLIKNLAKQLVLYLDKTTDVTRWEAMYAYMLSKLYLEEKDEHNYLKYLTYSAKVDVMIANKDIASLQELGEYMLDKNDIDHAYSYLSYCLLNSQLYKNRIRTMQLSNLLNKVHRIISDQSMAQQKKLTRYIMFMLILLLVCLFGVIIIIYQNKRLNNSRQKLKDANTQLNQHVEEISLARNRLTEANDNLQLLNKQLETLNEQLLESNYVKEEYVGYAFNLCSTYIAKLDEYRIKINRKMKANQADDVLKLTSQSIASNEAMKDFYQTFDAVFLKIYPNFVDDFNKLLRPEEQIKLKEENALTMELRIYALVRLGISDSVRIADFLHCSAQTIYNNRMKTRNKSDIPRDEFAERVKWLGKRS